MLLQRCVTREVPVRNYTVVDTVYSANAQKMASDWVSRGFWLDDQGRYSNDGTLNPYAYTRSTPIKLPALEENQKIIMQVKGFYRVLYPLSGIRILISTDGGKNFDLFAGIGGGVKYVWDRDFDLSKFANKEII